MAESLRAAWKLTGRQTRDPALDKPNAVRTRRKRRSSQTTLSPLKLDVFTGVAAVRKRSRAEARERSPEVEAGAQAEQGGDHADDSPDEGPAGRPATPTPTAPRTPSHDRCAGPSRNQSRSAADSPEMARQPFEAIHDDPFDVGMSFDLDEPADGDMQTMSDLAPPPPLPDIRSDCSMGDREEARSSEQPPLPEEGGPAQQLHGQDGPVSLPPLGQRAESIPDAATVTAPAIPAAHVDTGHIPLVPVPKISDSADIDDLVTLGRALVISDVRFTGR